MNNPGIRYIQLVKLCYFEVLSAVLICSRLWDDPCRTTMTSFVFHTTVKFAARIARMEEASTKDHQSVTERKSRWQCCAGQPKGKHKNTFKSKTIVKSMRHQHRWKSTNAEKMWENGCENRKDNVLAPSTR